MTIIRIARHQSFQKIVVVAAVVTLASTMLEARENNKPLRPDDTSSLRARALKAKRLGKTSISLAAPHATTAQPEPLDGAFAHTTLVLARFLGRAISHDDDFITTWRKYRILEKLSSQPIVWEDSDEPFLKYVPGSLLPIAQDEFVMGEPGGVDVIDGITVTMRSSENHALLEKEPLLMFLVFASSGAIAALNYGSLGAFWIDQSETVHAMDASPGNHLWSELSQRGGSTLTGLRALANSPSQAR